MTRPALDLDWQLRRAADSLRRATASIPADGPSPPPRRARRIVAGIVLVAAVVAGAALIWRGDQRRTPRVTTGPPSTDVAPLILDPLPDGMAPRDARDLSSASAAASAASDERLTLTLYRGTLAFNGNAAVDLGVVVVENHSIRPTDGTPVVVRGQPGESYDVGPFEGPAVVWEESDREITLASHTLDTSLLLTVADGLRITEAAEDTTVELGPLPAAIAGLAPVARLEDVDVTTFADPSEGGHIVSYAGDAGSVTVIVVPGDADRLAVMAWAVDATQMLDADGRTIATAQRPDSTTAVWQEDDGTVVQLVASNATPADLAALITDRLREPTDAEWQAAIEADDP